MSRASICTTAAFRCAAILGIASLSLAGCATSAPPSLASLDQTVDSGEPAGTAAGKGDPKKAVQYWGKAYAKNPRDPEAAINYARNLKAVGDKRQAFAVLQLASSANGGTHRGINSEYGRLALELDQIGLAEKLLEQADDPANPDWKVISARATVLAKQGQYGAAIPLYERALSLSPGQPSILNNLALAQAMEGNAEKAEGLLRQAVAGGAEDGRVMQNLALVLGLQGKYDEAKLTASRHLPADLAAANADYLKRMVQVEPKPMTTASVPAADRTASASTVRPGASVTGWVTKVAETKPEI